MVLNAFTSLSVQNRQREALYANKRRVQFDIPTTLHTLQGTKVVTNKVRIKTRECVNSYTVHIGF